MGGISDPVMKAILAGKRATEGFIWLVGPFFILVASTLIPAVMVIHFRVLLPHYTPYNTFLGFIHTLWSVYVVFCIGFNYYNVVFSLPGKIPDAVTDEERKEIEKLKRNPSPRKGEGFSRYCKLCKKVKPPRAHHCHVCGKCVLRMDHHCPWIGNCVGFYNHKYFILFLFYMFIGAIWVSCESFFPFSEGNQFRLGQKNVISRGSVIFVFVLALSVSFAVGLLLFWHLYLAMSNQTTIEFYYNRFKSSQASSRNEIFHNEYDLGVKRNWQLFFGQTKKNWWYMWFLPSLQSPPGDGTAFHTRYGTIGGTPIHFGDPIIEQFV